MTQDNSPAYIETEKRIDKVRDEYALVEGHFDTSEERRLPGFLSAPISGCAI